MKLLDDPLSVIGRAYGTDKVTPHEYTPKYDRHFRHLRDQKINLLEIGIGGYSGKDVGYKNPDKGGGSLRMWETYFKKGKIFGLDIEKKNVSGERIKIFRGSQTDRKILEKINTESGGLDIIIDDGSHKNQHVRKSFQILFPLLKPGGIYVIEDIQTSYWIEEGGFSSRYIDWFTSMGLLKRLCDGLNYAEFSRQSYKPNYFDLNVVGLHFYQNIVFIEKGDNQYKSVTNARRLERSFLSKVVGRLTKKFRRKNGD